MSMLALFDLDTPAWAPIFRQHLSEGGIAAAIGDDRCRDCGKKCGYNQGGADRRGSFTVCDGCAEIDGCHLKADGHHVSHWGESHPAEDHDRLVAEQTKRRASYLRAVAA